MTTTLPGDLFPITQDTANAAFDMVASMAAATGSQTGKASAHVDCNVTFASSGDLVAHAVLEFAF